MGALSYEKGLDLAFDTDALRTAANKYKQVSTDLSALSNQLNSLLSQLVASGWTTNAGKAFQKMVEQDWSEALSRYCDLLETLSSILNEAAERYEDLVDQDVLQLTMS